MDQVDLADIADGVFQAELEFIRFNLQAWLESRDPLYLHDLRVANRRVRAGLRTFKPLLPGNVLEKYRADFRWIQQITCEARDLDIYLQDFPGYKRHISRSWHPHLLPFEVVLRDRQLLAHDRLADDLRSDRLQTILDSWSDFLGSKVIEDFPAAQDPAREYGCGRILSRYHQAQEQGAALTEDSDPRTFHLYRILLKGLRYRMDFFRPVLPSRRLARTLSRMKRVQDAFGHYQDKQVQLRITETFMVESQKSGLSVDSILALNRLVGVLEAGIEKDRKRCLRQARWLISETTSRRFRSCFARG
jgi:CHAD domain-containing protein